MTASGRPIATIMVVDDDEDIRYMMRVLLEEDGYHVLEAENGQRALEIAQNGHLDIILMDLSMPVLDGFAASRRLRQQSKLCDCRSLLSLPTILPNIAPMPPPQESTNISPSLWISSSSTSSWTNFSTQPEQEQG